MTVIGSGGVLIREISLKTRFERDFKKLTPELQQLCSEALASLLKNPMPPRLRFEKLKGYKNPSIYSIHITGNYKVSLEITGDIAQLRRVACHDEIDRAP